MKLKFPDSTRRSTAAEPVSICKSANLELLQNGNVVAGGPLSQTNSVVIQAAPGDNDTLTLDFSGGSFSIPSDAWRWTGQVHTR